MNLSALAPFSLLSLALLSLGLRRQSMPVLRDVWLVLLVSALLTAVLLSQISLSGLAMVLLLVLSAGLVANARLSAVWRWLAGALALTAMVSLALHWVPGFQSIAVIEPAVLSPGARPFALYLHLDKILLGLLLLGFFYRRPAQVQSLADTLVTVLWLAPLTAVLVLASAWVLGFVHWAPKLIDGLGFWMWGNLFSTCVTEEAFFRGLIQHHLAQRWHQRPSGALLATITTALIFGLAHAAGGSTLMLLATLAGVGYGLLYQFTGRIEASILGHFCVNLLHLLLFTYPGLA